MPVEPAQNPLSRTIIVHVEDRPGSLNRVVSLFRRRAYNIDSLTVGRSEKPDVSRITLVVRADPSAAARIEAHLYKLVDVLRVEEVSTRHAVIRELVFVKIGARGREGVLRISETFGARVVDAGASTITLESTGAAEHIDAFIAALRPHDILELVRTGAVAMTRGAPDEHPATPSLSSPLSQHDDNPGSPGEARDSR